MAKVVNCIDYVSDSRGENSATLTHSKVLTHEEYERRYQEALFVLRQSGRSVGRPYETKDQTRVITIGEKPCSDWMVFSLAWGDSTADSLVRMAPKRTR